MSNIYETGARGVRMLAKYLSDRGRRVRASDRKTFDLIVDDKYAEVKSSNGPYERLGFIGLTDAQYRALREGVDFSIFVVCSAESPNALEVLELDAADLLNEEPKVECTYYWYRSQLERCRRQQTQPRLTSVNAPVQRDPVGRSDETTTDMSVASISHDISARVRRLARSDNAPLYIGFSPAQLELADLRHGQRVEIDLDGRATIVGIVKTSDSTQWLAPDTGSSHAQIDRVLRSAGFRYGDDVPSHIRRL